MELNGKQRQEFYEALLNAFPVEEDLARMLSFRMDESFSELCIGNSYRARIFSLIRWAESRGKKLEELLNSALSANPENPRLLNFKNKHFPTQSKAEPENSSQKSTPQEVNLEAKEINAKNITLDGSVTETSFQNIGDVQNLISESIHIFRQRAVLPFNCDQVRQNIRDISAKLESTVELLNQTQDIPKDLYPLKEALLLNMESLQRLTQQLSLDISQFRSTYPSNSSQANQKKASIQECLKNVQTIILRFTGNNL